MYDLIDYFYEFMRCIEHSVDPDQLSSLELEACFVSTDACIPVDNIYVLSEQFPVFLGCTSTKQWIQC